MSETATQTAVEASAAVTSGAVKATVAGGSAAAAGKFMGLDPVTAMGLLIAIAGLCVSFLSFLINWYYKKKEDQRADELHRIALKKANGECNVE